MEATRLIQKPQNGKITFDVPDDMRDDLIIIDYQPVRDEQPTSFNPGLAEASKAFFAKLSRVKIDFNEEDYNVYEQ